MLSQPYPPGFRPSSHCCANAPRPHYPPPTSHFSLFILKVAPFSGQGIGTTSSRYTIIYKGDATAINSNDTDPIGGYTQSNTAVSSVTDAIKTPNTYYYYYDSGTGNNYTWYNFGDISLWSDYGTNKSIYDPCPYGYRVPKSGATTASSWYGFSVTPTGQSVAVDAGSIWSSIWWPAAGYRSYSSGSLGGVGNTAYYWSSTRHSTAYVSYNLYFNYGGAVYLSNDDYRSNGFSVRCVQERGRASRGTWDVGLGSVGVRDRAGRGVGEW